MNRSKIEWLKNPDGSQGFEWDPFEHKTIDLSYELNNVRAPTQILVTHGEDFLSRATPEEIKLVIEKIKKYPKHTFILLTKNPKPFTDYEWPENVRAGQIINRQSDVLYMKYLLSNTIKFKFIVFDPLLERVSVRLGNIDWVIIGQDPETPVKPYWIEEIWSNCYHSSVSLYVKDPITYHADNKDIPGFSHDRRQRA